MELVGKYNTAKIFTDLVEETAVEQIRLLLDQEFCKDSKIRIMPDVHAGSGCTIGTTMTIHDKIVPNLVGVDIGCGMYCLKIEETDFDPAKLDDVIHAYIPSGRNIHDEEDKGYCGTIESLIAPVNKAVAYRSIGSLGGGNHFVEVDKDSAGNLYLVIHSGSRHLGLEVAKYYQETAYKSCKKPLKGDVIHFIEEYKKAGRQKEIEGALKKLYNTAVTDIPKELCYLTGLDMQNYIHDMEIVNDFARANRQKMADIILSHMNWHVSESFTTKHNYIDTKYMILRKGSVSARKDEKLIIPMNMRDGSLLCIGKGNDDWNQSAPHGAGRLMSRGEARKQISMETYKSSMENVWTTSVNESTLDEAPEVYKPMISIIENIKDTVDIERIIKPVYNFKASE